MPSIERLKCDGEIGTDVLLLRRFMVTQCYISVCEGSWKEDNFGGGEV